MASEDRTHDAELAAELDRVAACVLHATFEGSPRARDRDVVRQAAAHIRTTAGIAAELAMVREEAEKDAAEWSALCHANDILSTSLTAAERKLEAAVLTGFDAATKLLDDGIALADPKWPAYREAAARTFLATLNTGAEHG